MLAQLPKLHVAYRVVGRARLGLLTTDRTARRTVLVAAFAAYDALGAWWMSRHDDPPHFPLRVAADLADMMFWAVIEDDAFDNVVTVGNVTSAEAGVRFGPRGFGVAALQAAAVVAARRVAGKRTPLYPFFWAFLSAGAGWALVSYEQRRLERLRSAQDIAIAGRAERSRLAGQHAVAMGADPVVDLLVRTTPLLAGDGEGPRQDPIHAWKGQLAEQARSAATYLADAARSWEASHNASTPVLADNVEVVLEPGADQVLLTAGQVGTLQQYLHALGLAGRVRLDPELGGLGHRPGTAIRIAVNGSTGIDLPADEMHSSPPMNPAPLSFAMMVLWIVNQSNTAYEAVPLSRTAPGALGALGAAVVLHRRVVGGQVSVSRPALTTSLVLALGNTLLVTPALGNDLARDGIQNHPCVSTLYGPCILAAIYWPDLSTSQRLLAVGTIAVVLALGLLVRPWPSRLRDLAASVALLAVAIGAASGWGSILSQQAEAVALDVEQRADRAEMEAFLTGREQVIGLVTAAVDAAHRRFESCVIQLDPRMANVVASRLAELDERLDGLR
jgi:hypothetical protein